MWVTDWSWCLPLQTTVHSYLGCVWWLACACLCEWCGWRGAFPCVLGAAGGCQALLCFLQLGPWFFGRCCLLCPFALLPGGFFLLLVGA